MVKRPDAKDPKFVTADQYIDAMQEWAESLAKPVLFVKLTFDDGGSSVDYFECHEREVVFSVRRFWDHEPTWSVRVDVKKFVNSWLPGEYCMTAAEIKKAYAAWMQAKSIKPETVEWGYTTDCDKYHGRAPKC